MPPPLTEDQIGDDGAKALAEALKVNGTLTLLIVVRMFPLHIRKGWRSGLGRRLENTPGGVGRCVFVRCLGSVRGLGPGDVGLIPCLFSPASHGPLPSPLYERECVL